MPSQTQGPRILIVDDEEAVRALLTEVVHRAGYECTAAAAAPDALRVLENESFDVVVTDIHMPGMSGVDLVRAVRDRHDTDVVILTGFASDESHRALLEHGVSDCILKPCRPTEFLARLRRVLAERASRQQHRRGL